MPGTIMNVILGVWCIASLIAITSLTLRFFPGIARAVMGHDPPDRVNALDGLRGLLALSVFVHHGIVAKAYYHHGKLPNPISIIYWGERPLHCFLWSLLTCFGGAS